MAADAEVGELTAGRRVEGVERPVGRDVREAERTQKTERREVGGFPLVETEVRHVLDGGAERAEVALVREDGQCKADGRHRRACLLETRAQLGAARGEQSFDLLAARMADGKDDFIEIGDVLGEGLLEAELAALAGRRVGDDARRRTVAEIVKDAGDTRTA